MSRRMISYPTTTTLRGGSSFVMPSRTLRRKMNSQKEVHIPFKSKKKRKTCTHRSHQSQSLCICAMSGTLPCQCYISAAAAVKGATPLTRSKCRVPKKCRASPGGGPQPGPGPGQSAGQLLGPPKQKRGHDGGVVNSQLDSYVIQWFEDAYFW